MVLISLIPSAVAKLGCLFINTQISTTTLTPYSKSDTYYIVFSKGVDAYSSSGAKYLRPINPLSTISRFKFFKLISIHLLEE